MLLALPSSLVSPLNMLFPLAGPFSGMLCQFVALQTFYSRIHFFTIYHSKHFEEEEREKEFTCVMASMISLLLPHEGFGFDSPLLNLQLCWGLCGFLPGTTAVQRVIELSTIEDNQVYLHRKNQYKTNPLICVVKFAGKQVEDHWVAETLALFFFYWMKCTASCSNNLFLRAHLISELSK